MSANMVAANASRSNSKPGANKPDLVMQQRQLLMRLWALAGATLVLGLAYGPNFLDLHSTWASDPNYSHGYLVIPIALFILWQRLSAAAPELAPGPIPAPWWGWASLTAVLVVRALAYDWNLRWTETATILPAIACLTWIFGGWPLLRRAWLAIAFLVFMLPLPPQINDLITLPLQHIAATGSCFLLQTSGLWSIQEGNTINVSTPHGMEPLDVAVACSGLRMLMTLAATVTATIILIPLPTWKRITLLVSAVPIALLTNMIRIVATGWCYHLVEGARAKQLAHDWSGYLMMPLALVLVGLELGILSWLVPAEDEADQEDRQPLLPLLTGPGKAGGEAAPGDRRSVRVR
jgi:exosortase